MQTLQSLLRYRPMAGSRSTAFEERDSARRSGQGRLQTPRTESGLAQPKRLRALRDAGRAQIPGYGADRAHASEADSLAERKDVACVVSRVRVESTKSPAWARTEEGAADTSANTTWSSCRTLDHRHVQWPRCHGRGVVLLSYTSHNIHITLTRHVRQRLRPPPIADCPNR